MIFIIFNVSNELSELFFSLKHKLRVLVFNIRVNNNCQKTLIHNKSNTMIFNVNTDLLAIESMFNVPIRSISWIEKETFSEIEIINTFDLLKN